jgi:hypothetical protein
MELTRDVEAGIGERINTDPAFAIAILDEIDELIVAGDDEVARGMLRIMTVATIGFDALSHPLSITGEMLRGILSADSPPTKPSLSAVVSALKRELGVAAS